MFKKITLSLMMLLLLASCAPAFRSSAVPPQSPSVGGVAPSESQRQAVAGGQGNVYSSQIPEVKRIVIKNASLSLAVDSPPQSMDNITKMAEEMGGFVVSANLTRVNTDSGVEVPEAKIVIRIPADRLDEALARIKTETKRPVISENVDSQDVTSDYTDLQSRLRNLEAAQVQLKEIMASAQKTEDVLSVYNQLTQVQEQIEVLKGKIQYYDQSAALSSITVQLQANEAVQTLTIGGWQPGGIAKSALQATINAYKFLAGAAIWIVLFAVPVLFGVVLPFFVLFLIVRAIRRSRRKTPPAAPAPVQ